MTKSQVKTLYMIAIAIGMMLGTKNPREGLKIAGQLFEGEYNKAKRVKA